MMVWVWGYLRDNRSVFCQLFLFLGPRSLLQYYPGTSSHQCCHRARARAAGRQKIQLAKQKSLHLGRLMSSQVKKRCDCVQSLKGKIQKHFWETTKMLFKSEGRQKSKQEGWPLYRSHLPSSNPAVPGLQYNIWECFSNLRISTAPSCLGKMLKNYKELKDCRIINTCQHGFKKSRSHQTNLN